MSVADEQEGRFERQGAHAMHETASEVKGLVPLIE